MRANNYYDNFRSFSRQNRFGTHPLSAAAANVERRPADSLPANNTASGYNRTRKKYKINREQNRYKEKSIFWYLSFSLSLSPSVHLLPGSGDTPYKLRLCLTSIVPGDLMNLKEMEE